MGKAPSTVAKQPKQQETSGGVKRSDDRKSRSRSRDRRQSAWQTTVREKKISPPRGILPPKWQTTDVDELIREVEDAVKGEDVKIPQLMRSKVKREEEKNDKARSPSPASKKKSSKTDKEDVDDEIRKLREENEKLKAEM